MENSWNSALNIPINKVEEAKPSSSKSSTLAAPLPPTPHQSFLPPTSIAPTKDEAKATTTVENGPSTPAPSLQKQWRDQKYKDEKDMRQKQIRLLQLEKQDREKARHNRELDEEEHRRIRLRLEGLVLERKVPPREEFPGLWKKQKWKIQSKILKNCPHVPGQLSTHFGIAVLRMMRKLSMALGRTSCAKTCLHFLALSGWTMKVYLRIENNVKFLHH